MITGLQKAMLRNAFGKEMPVGAQIFQNRAFQCEKIVTGCAKFVTKNLGASRIKESQNGKFN